MKIKKCPDPDVTARRTRLMLVAAWLTAPLCSLPQVSPIYIILRLLIEETGQMPIRCERNVLLL